MAATPLPSSDTPPEPETERLADLDSRLAGDHGPGGAPTGGGEASDSEPRIPLERIDRLLQLNQLGAAWRESAGREAVSGPRRIDRFEIVREVGQGGFATVYEALDTLLGRRVALKVAHPEALVSPALKRRFLREAELAARVVHPNLVTIYDIGQPQGMAFIAEELCAGGTLAAWLERHPGPVEPRRAAAIVKAVAEGLDAAHQRGIIHRDIKPENILLAAATDGGLLPAEGAGAELAAGAGWTVKLGDFGLGAIDDDGPDALSRLTRAGASLGTPAWMAPEQIDRTLGPVGPATDVHALGLLLDRLLVGRCRWVGKTDSETMRLILLREPEVVERPVAGVPRDLAAVCRTCLARSPADRYARAGDVATDLARFLVGVPTRARPLAAWQRAVRFAARRPAAVAAVLAVCAATLVAGLALRGWSVQASSSARQRDALRRIDAALDLQRGLADLATGNVAAARERFATSAGVDPALDGSFAGRWARRRLRGERQVLVGDPAAPAAAGGAARDLYCSAVSPDGERIAVGAADGRLILVAADGTTAPTVVAGAHDEINDVAFSPDGRLVATAGEDGRVRVFTAASGALQRDLATEAEPLFAVAFAPDGTRLAWAGAGRVLAIANVAGGTATRFAVPLSVAPDTEGSDVEALAFIDDDRIVAVGGEDVILLSTIDGAVIRRFVGHRGSIGCLDVSPDGTRLVTAGTDLTPLVWDVATGSVIRSLATHPDWVQGCAFTAAGTRIVTGCRDGVLQIFDAATGAQLERLPGHVGRTWDVRREPGGTVLSTGADGTLRRWTVEHVGGFPGGREWAVAADAIAAALPVGGWGTPDGNGDGPSGGPEVVVVRPLGAPLVVDTARGTARQRWTFPRDQSVVDAALDVPRGRLAVVHGGGGVGVFAVGDGAAAEQVIQGMYYRIAWTPSGQAVTVSPGEASVARGFDSALADEVEIDRLGQLADVLAVAPDGGTVATGGRSSLRFTPIATRGPPRAVGATRAVAVDPSFGNVTKIAWAPDGQRLAIGSSSGNVRIVDGRDGQPLHVLPGHRGSILSLAWSADGRIVISADAESLRVTDSVTAVGLDACAPGWKIRSLVLAGPPSAPDRWLVVGGMATEDRTTADGVPGRGRLLVVDLGE